MAFDRTQRDHRAGKRVGVGVGRVGIHVEIGVLAGEQVEVAVGRDVAADDDLVVRAQIDVAVGVRSGHRTVGVGVHLRREVGVAVGGEDDLADAVQCRAALDIDLGEVLVGLDLRQRLRARDARRRS